MDLDKTLDQDLTQSIWKKQLRLIVGIIFEREA